MNALPRKSCLNSQTTVWFSKCLQISVSLISWFPGINLSVATYSYIYTYTLSLLSLLSLVVAWWRILMMEILQLLYSRRYCPVSIPQLVIPCNYSAIPSRPSLQNSTELIESQRQSHIATLSQSVSVSSPIWGSWPDIWFCLTVNILFLGAPSLTRGWVCLLSELMAPAVLVVTSLCGPHRKHRFSVVRFGSVAVEACLSSCCLDTGYVTPFIKNLLP
jgi:hypothetical protein